MFPHMTPEFLTFNSDWLNSPINFFPFILTFSVANLSGNISRGAPISYKQRSRLTLTSRERGWFTTCNPGVSPWWLQGGWDGSCFGSWYRVLSFVGCKTKSHTWHGRRKCNGIASICSGWSGRWKVGEVFQSFSTRTREGNWKDNKYKVNNDGSRPNEAITFSGYWEEVQLPYSA